jgi:hypothetical protein
MTSSGAIDPEILRHMREVISSAIATRSAADAKAAA